MNSREKQRSVYNEKTGVVTKIRQLPLYMKVINVILAIVLAFGVCTNWQYAAEVLSLGESAFAGDSTFQEVSINFDQEETLVAPNPEGAWSYQWCVYADKLGGYIPIEGETNPTFTVDYAVVKDVLDTNNIAKVCSRVIDYDGNVITNKYYRVIVTVPKEILNQDISEQISAQLKANFSVKTSYVNEYGVVLNDKKSNTEDSLSASNEKEITVKVTYVDNYGHDLGVTTNYEFNQDVPFDWFLEITSGMGKPTEVIHDYNNTPSSSFNVARLEPHTGQDGIYIYTATGVNPSQTVKKDGVINVTAKIDVESAKYTLKAQYEGLTDGVYDPALSQTIVKTGPIGSQVPTTDDLEYLCEQTANGKGWMPVKYEGKSIVYSETGIEVEVKLARTYSILQFDKMEGSNGPAAVYIKHGQNFNTIPTWKTTDAEGNIIYKPNPEPERQAYNFTYWSIDKPVGDTPGTQKMPEDWSTYAAGAPGEDTIYYANWELAAPTEKVTVVIAYWGEVSYSSPWVDGEPEYEYLAERYDRVDANKIGTTYTLPGKNLGTTAYNPTNCHTDRRFPQVREGDDEFIIDNAPLENVPTAPEKTYEELYLFWKSVDCTVKADGTAVCNVMLRRHVYKYEFYNTYNEFGGTPFYSLYAKWDQPIYESTDQNPIIDPRDGTTKEMGWKDILKSKNTSRTIMDKSGSTTTYCSLETHMRYFHQTGWRENIPSNPYNPSTDDYYWGYTRFGCDYSSTTKYGATYYLQKVGKPYHHKAQDITNMSSLTLQQKDKYRNQIFYRTIENADNYTADGILSKTSYAENFDKTYSTFTWDTYNNTGMVNVFVPIVGFSGGVRGEDSVYSKKLDTSKSDDYTYFKPNNAPTGSVGYSFYYKRNTNAIYLRNVFGCENDYHYDNCIIIDPLTQYGMPFNLIAFAADEQSEKQSGQYSDGVTGIKAQDLLTNQVQSKIKPPSWVDEHFVFDGWYEDSGFVSKIDPETWKMPNHEQDIYANWKAPDRKIQFYTLSDPKVTPTSETPGEVLTRTYDQHLQDGDAPDIPKYDNCRFISWYYYASEEDMREDNKTYFDPSPDGMKMPWVDWGENNLLPGQENAEPIIYVHQYWVVDQQANYSFDYKLIERDAEGNITSVDTVVAPSTTGILPYEESVKVDVTDKPQTDFNFGYQGVLRLADKGVKWDEESGKWVDDEEGTNPAEYTINITRNEDNTHTFYYEYDKEFYWNYRCYVRDYSGTDTPIPGMGVVPETEGGEIEPWQPSGNNGHDAQYSFLVPTVEQLPEPYCNACTLISTNVITKNLIADDPAAGEGEHPEQNIIDVYYTVNDPVDFYFYSKTVKANGSDEDAGFLGGTIDVNEAKNIDIILGYNTATHQQPKSIATVNPGAKLLGWYKANVDVVQDEQGKVISATFKSIDWESGAVSNENEFLAPRDENSGVYENNGYYVAVFTYGDDVNFKYQYKVLNEDEAHPVTGIELTKELEGPFNPITTPTTDVLGSTITVPEGYHVKYWVNSSEDPVSAEGATSYIPTQKTYGSGASAYKYWESDTFTAIVEENSAVKITYKVADSDKDFGDLTIPTVPPQTKDYYEDSVAPASGTPLFPTAAAASKYKFDYWEEITSGQQEGEGTHLECGETLEFFPQDGLWTPRIFVAHFVLDEITISFEENEGGYIDSGNSITVNSGVEYSVNNTGAISMQNTAGETITNTPIPYWGYKLDTQNLVWQYKDESHTDWTTLNKSPRIFEVDTTLRALFVEGDNVSVKYTIASDSKSGSEYFGYFKVATDTRNLTDYEDVFAPINPQDGHPYTVTAYDNTEHGYKFAYWTKDKEIAETEEDKIITPAIRPEKETVEGHDAYASHTYYAHFETYDCEVTFQIFDSYQDYSIIDPTDTGVETKTVTVKSTSTYNWEDITGELFGEKESKFILTNSDGGEKTEITTKTKKTSADDPLALYSWSAWYERVAGTTPSIKNLPSIITGDITICATMQEAGDTDYEITYKLETLESAEWRIDHPLDEPSYDEDKVYTYDGKAKAGTTPSVPTLAEIFRQQSVTDYDANGFEFKSFEGKPTDEFGNWYIIENPGLNDNKATVCYTRKTDMTYKVVIMLETVDSAKANATQPIEWSSDREYKFYYEETMRPEDWDTKIIYGSTRNLKLAEWLPGLDLKYFVLLDPDGETKPDADGYVPYTVGNSCKYQHVGETIEPYTCYMYVNRQMLDFEIQYYVQNVNDTEYTLTDTISSYDGNYIPEELKSDFRSWNGDTVALFNDGQSSLKDVYDISKWNYKVGGTGTETYIDKYKGLHYLGTIPNDGKLYNSVTLDAGHGVAQVYFGRDENTKYTINYYVEDPANALKRFADPTYTEIKYLAEPKDSIDYSGKTGSSVNTETDAIKYFYYDDGYTWVSSDPSPTAVIKGDGSTLVKVYYKSNLDTTFNVEYYLQDIDTTTQQPKENSYTKKDTINYTAPSGTTLYTNGNEQTEGMPNIYKVYAGFKPNYDKSEPKPSVVISRNMGVVKLYYDRNIDTPWQIRYELQRLNTETGQPIPNVYDEKETITTDKDGNALVATTGAFVDFGEYVSEEYKNKYLGYSFEYTIPAPVGDKYQLEVTADDSGVLATAVVRYKLEKNVPYKILHLAKNISTSDYETLVTEDNVGYIGSIISLQPKQIAGYTYNGTREPSSGTITVGTKVRDTDDCAVGRIYYGRNSNTKYTVQYWKETLEHAKNPEVDGGYDQINGDTLTPEGTTGADVKISTYVKEDKYAGYHFGHTSPATETVKIAGNGSTVINIYYDRNTDQPYTIRFYKETVDHAKDHSAAKVLEDQFDTETRTGITGDSVVLESDTSITEKYVGFTWGDIEGSDYKSDRIFEIGENAETNFVNEYYSRNANISYTFQYWFGDVETAKQTVKNYVHDETTKEKYLDDKTGIGVFGEEVGTTISSSSDPSEWVPDVEGFTHGPSDPVLYLKLGVNEEDNVAKIYYNRRTDIKANVYHNLETFDSAKQMKDPIKWNPADGYHAYETDFDYTDNITNGVYEGTINLTNYDKTIQGFTTPLGYKLGGDDGEVIESPTEAVLKLNEDENAFYIYYERNASVEFKVQYMVETLDWATGRTTDPSKHWEPGPTDEYKNVQIWKAVYETSVDNNYVDIQPNDNHGPLVKTAEDYDAFKGFTFDKLDPQPFVVNWSNPSEAKTINVYYSRNYYNPDPDPTPPDPPVYDKVGYTVEYWGLNTDTGQYTEKLTNGNVTDGKKDVDAVFGEYIDTVNYTSKAGFKINQEFDNYTFNSSKTVGIPCTITDALTDSTRPVIKLYYDANWIGPEAITVNYKGLSLDAAKSKTSYEITDYTEDLENDVVSEGKLGLGAYLNSHIDYGYTEPKDPFNSIAQSFVGFSSINESLTEVNGEKVGSLAGINFDVKDSGNTITIYYNRDYYDPDDPGFTVKYMTQKLQSAKDGKYGDDDYDLESTIKLGGWYGDTVTDEYIVNKSTSERLKDHQIAGFYNSTHRQPYDPEGGFTISNDHKQTITLYYDRDYYYPDAPGFTVIYMTQKLDSAKAGHYTDSDYEQYTTVNVGGWFGDIVTDEYVVNKNTNEKLKDYSIPGFTYTTNRQPYKPAEGFTISNDHKQTITLYYDRNYYDPGFTVKYMIQKLDSAKVGGHADSDYILYDQFTLAGWYEDKVTDEFINTTTNKKLNERVINGFYYSTQHPYTPDGGFNINNYHDQTIILYYDRDYYEPQTPGFTVKYMVQKLDSAKKNQYGDNDYEYYGQETVGGYFEDRVTDTYENPVTHKKLNEKVIDGFSYSNHHGYTPSGGFEINSNHDQTITLYYDRDYYYPSEPGFKVTYMIQKLDSAKAQSYNDNDYTEYKTISLGGYFGDRVTDTYINTDTNKRLNEYEISGFTYSTHRPGYSPYGGFDIDSNHNQTIILYYDRNHYDPGFTVRYMTQRLQSAKDKHYDDDDYVLFDEFTLDGYYDEQITDAYVNPKTGAKLNARSIEGFTYSTSHHPYTPSGGFYVDNSQNQVITLYYDRNYIEPSDPAFTVRYMIQKLDSAKAGKFGDNDYELKDEFKFGGYYGDSVTDTFINPDTGDPLNEREIEGFTYSTMHHPYTPSGGFEINNSHKQVITLYYDRNYYDPQTPGFTVKYMIQKLDSAKDGKFGDNDYDQYSKFTLGGYFEDKVTDEFINPDTGKKLNALEIKGFTYSTSHHPYMPSGGFTINNDHNQTITLYYDRNYYDPDPDDPTPDPPIYHKVGYTVEYWGQDVNTGLYSLALSNDNVTGGKKDVDAFFEESITKSNYKEYTSKDGFKINQQFEYFTLVDSKTEGLPCNITDAVTESSRPVIKLYYNADYIDPDPDPDDSALTVHYKGLSLTAAMSKPVGSYIESDYTEDLSNRYVSNGTLALGAFYNANITYDYKEPYGNRNTIKQSFTGFDNINESLTNVNGTRVRSLSDINFNIAGKGNEITIYYNRNYYDPDDPDPVPPVYGDVGYTVEYWGLNVNTGRYETKLSNRNVSDGKKEVDAFYGEHINSVYYTSKDGFSIYQEFENYTFVNSKTEGIPCDITDALTQSSRPVIKLYYDANWIGPDPDPQKSALTVYYKGLSLNAAMNRPVGSYVESDYTDDLSNNVVKNGQLALGAFMNANVTYYYSEPTGAKNSIEQSFDGFDCINESLTKVNGVTVGSLSAINFNVLGKGNTITIYYNRDYYDPDPDDPWPDPPIYDKVGYTVEYWGLDVNTGKYTTQLSNKYVSDGKKEVDAFFGEYINTVNYTSKDGFKIYQEFENYTFVSSKTEGLPCNITSALSESSRPVIKLYYDANWIGPDPDPQKSALTVYYKGLSLEAAKSKSSGNYTESDYTVDLKNTVVSGGKLALGAFMNANITYDYQEPSGNKNTIKQAFTGFDTINESLTKVNGDKVGSLSAINFNVNGTGNTITIYYNRNYYEPDDPGFTVQYKIQKLDSAKKELFGDNDYENYKEIKLGGWFEDKVTDEFVNPDTNKKLNEFTIEGFTYSSHHPYTPTGGFEINNDHNQTITLYYDRDCYNPDPDDPTPDPPVFNHAGYTITHMVESLDYCLYQKGERFEQRGETVEMKAWFGEEITAKPKDTSNPIGAEVQRFLNSPENKDGFTLLESDPGPVDPTQITVLDIDNEKWADECHFTIYYTRNMSKEVTYQLIKMVKNEDYALGDVTQPEYVQYGDAETKKAYFEEVIDASRSDLWPQTIDNTYKFENRCDPTSISPWEANQQVFMLNTFADSADNANIPTISGFYDFINQPEPPQPDPPQPTPTPTPDPDVPGGGGTSPTQTGDIIGMGMVAGLSALALLGLFVAMKRRKKAQKRA